MMIKKMIDLDLKGKRVIVREDFNVPIQAGRIDCDIRLRAALPTIQYLIGEGAAIILLSHLGRPEAGRDPQEFSLAPVAERLSSLLGHPVHFMKEWLSGVVVQPGEVVLCENVRFNRGEQADDPGLAQQMAKLGDVFVMDAFAVSHRAQASTHGIARYIEKACAGPLLVAELEAINKALEAPIAPVLAIVGGAKVSTKLEVLRQLLHKVDVLIVGGGIANTFLAATGLPTGKSLVETALISDAKILLEEAKHYHKRIPLPLDVVVADSFSAQATATIKPCTAVQENDLILDIGPKTIALYKEEIAKAGTIFWNGPVGVFEFEPFSEGTRAIALAIASSQAYSLAGGGDTLAAIEKYHLNDKLSYVSTGGGALLELIEGKELPGISILNDK